MICRREGITSQNPTGTAWDKGAGVRNTISILSVYYLSSFLVVWMRIGPLYGISHGKKKLTALELNRWVLSVSLKMSNEEASISDYTVEGDFRVGWRGMCKEALTICDSTHRKGPVWSEVQNYIFAIS